MPYIPLAERKGYLEAAKEDAAWAAKHKPEDVAEYRELHKHHFHTLRRAAKAKIRTHVRMYVRSRKSKGGRHRATRRH